MNQRMTYREDGTFTIIQFTDVHWQDGLEIDRQTEKVIRAVLDSESPDLVVFTGDLIYPSDTTDPVEMMRQAVEPVVERGIPWAYVFGNHDTEKNISRTELIEAIVGQPHSITQRGPEHLSGEGNYVVEIGEAEGECEVALYFLDSGDVSSVPSVKGYDWIRRDQINWYAEQSREFASKNGGAPVPALAFFHIPLPEYEEMWMEKGGYGSKLEKVCCPKINSGMFTAMVEQGDVMGTFCGHDHLNDFWGEWYGIRLCYGRATGLNTYGREDFPHGARIIRLEQGVSGFSTWLRLVTGEKIGQQEQNPR
ncbi:metallophosphoesterase [Paenibacillus agaridevorans]|uniref:Metallophosphoesterase n=1 Tax=Paenibacillus agaridevorans TaxID=171404 RepID=A0A2R5EVT3_9BACL|nr:metallophosphoesterase family protein [Paenibacillus agaridevorans]GBG07511.1 metallophosphoesterase [Paenibacillus agaridevorans]